MVSSRPVGCTTEAGRLANGLYAARYERGEDGNREWRDIPWQEIAAWSEVETPTLVFVHGNRISWRETPSRGLYVYHKLRRCSNDARRIRFLIWSWQANEVKGMFLDYRLKAVRTGPVGFQLAWFLNQIPPDLPVSIVGYSYGARVASGAFHLLGGGDYCGKMIEPLSGPRRPMRAYYMAAAFNAHWLGPGQRHGRAMSMTERLLIATNRRDPAMRYFTLLPKAGNDQAMGYAGPTCLTREDARRVGLVNVTRSVGRSHDLCDHVVVPGLMSRAWRLLSFEDASSPAMALSGSPASAP